MKATEPEDVVQVWMKLFNSHDIEALACMYEEGAVLVTAPGQPPVAGVSAICAMWKAFMDAGAQLSISERTATILGEIALTQSRGQMTIPGVNPTEGCGVEVVRRQADGSWRYIICNPYGDAHVQTGALKKVD